VVERIVVTGAQGFLGRQLVATWLERDRRVRILGLGRSPRTDDVFPHGLGWAGRTVPAPVSRQLADRLDDPRYRYASADVCDVPQVAGLLDDFRPDVVVHAAAALRDAPLAELIQSNIQSTVGLLEAIDASALDAVRVVVVSSGSVYGNVGPPFVESDCCQPGDLYAVTKRTAEEISTILAAERGWPLVRARVFNLLGAGLQDRHLAAAVAAQLAAAKSGIGPSVLDLGPLDTTRDFVDICDAAAGVIIVAERGAAGAVYNIASGRETSVRWVVEELVRLSGLGDVEVRTGARRAHDVARAWADITSARSLGFEPAVATSTSLEAMLAYYDDEVAPRYRAFNDERRAPHREP